MNEAAIVCVTILASGVAFLFLGPLFTDRPR